MAYSKIVLGDKTLIDLTKDTVKPSNLLLNETAHGADGEEVIGTCDFDTNTTTSKAPNSNEILSGKEAFANGQKITGSMYNYGGNGGGDISSRDQDFTIPAGYHDGTGKVGISQEERNKIKSEYIKQGVTILGVEGSMSGTEGANAQHKEVTSSLTDFEVLPDSPTYNFLSSVTVKRIPVTYTGNEGGGQTVKIG